MAHVDKEVFNKVHENLVLFLSSEIEGISTTSWKYETRIEMLSALRNQCTAEKAQKRLNKMLIDQNYDFQNKRMFL